MKAKTENISVHVFQAVADIDQLFENTKTQTQKEKDERKANKRANMKELLNPVLQLVHALSELHNKHAISKNMFGCKQEGYFGYGKKDTQKILGSIMSNYMGPDPYFWSYDGKKFTLNELKIEIEICDAVNRYRIAQPHHPLTDRSNIKYFVSVLEAVEYHARAITNCKEPTPWKD